MITFVCIALIAIITGGVLCRTLTHSRLFTAITISAVCIAVGVYFIIGRPDYADQPYDLVTQNRKKLEQLTTPQLIEAYAKALEKNDTATGRFTLGTLLIKLNRLEDAKIHYAKAYDLDKNNTPNITISYAELLIILNHRLVSPKALNLVHETLKQDPSNLRGLLYQGLYYAQNKRHSQAVVTWKNLIEHSKNTQWQIIIEQDLLLIAPLYAIPLTKIWDIPPRHILPPSITGNAQKISPKDIPMIKNMIDQLEQKVAQNPNNIALRQRLAFVRKQFKALKMSFLKKTP